MIDGSNCTHEAVFPLFPRQNIVFAAESGSLAAFTSSTQRNDNAKFVHTRQSNNNQRELAVENLLRATRTRQLNCR
jgi:hypothetical protein